MAFEKPCHGRAARRCRGKNLVPPLFYMNSVPYGHSCVAYNLVYSPWGRGRNEPNPRPLWLHAVNCKQDKPVGLE